MVLADFWKFWSSEKMVPCREIKTWVGGYTGMTYKLICDRTDEHGDDHNWVHE